jgi:tetratricopeptide (TPR) repeat protein
MRGTTLLVTVALAALFSGPAAAQEPHHGHDATAIAVGNPSDGGPPLSTDLGTYHMAITAGTPEAQQYFDQGLRLTYGFNHAEAVASFKEGIRADSTCAMCWWGVANALGPNINLPMDTSAVKPAYEASRKALEYAAKTTPREQAFIQALAKRYADDPNASGATRAPLDSAYAKAMADVTRRFPKDDDAATLYAESLMDLRPWHYWTNAGRPLAPSTLETVSVLEQVVKRNPNHPGACHFYIHAVEASTDAARALPCAKKLQTLVPGAGHLVHMPTHIYMRLGMWELAVEHNEHAVAVDERFIQDRHPTGVYAIGYYPHNLDVMQSALGMMGRGDEMIAATRKIASIVGYDVAKQVPQVQSYTVTPFYAMARFSRWDEILKEPAPPADLRYTTGVWHYVRGLAFAAKEQYDSANVEHDSVSAIVASIDTTLPAGLNTAKTVLSIAERHLTADLASRQGKTGEALAALKQGIAIEDALTYSEPPDWYLPLRQPYAELLLKSGKKKEAIVAYQEDLRRFPNNVWSTKGLQRAKS